MKIMSHLTRRVAQNNNNQYKRDEKRFMSSNKESIRTNIQFNSKSTYFPNDGQPKNPQPQCRDQTLKNQKKQKQSTNPTVLYPPSNQTPTQFQPNIRFNGNQQVNIYTPKMIAEVPFEIKEKYIPQGQKQDPSGQIKNNSVYCNLGDSYKFQKTIPGKSAQDDVSKKNKKEQKIIYDGKYRQIYQKKIYSQKSQYKGLANVGSSCYANSALQCLQKSNIFNQKLKQIAGQRNMVLPLTQSYLEFLTEFNRDFDRPYYPTSILSLVKQRNCIFYYGQSDSVEFLSTFLAGIGQELNERPFGKKKKSVNREGITDDNKLFEATKVRDRVWSHSIVEQTFTGYYKTVYQCNQCQERYVLFEKFNVHYVPLPQPQPSSLSSYYYWQNGFRYYYQRKPEVITTLEECLKNFNNPEKMEGENAMDCDNPKCSRHSPRKRWSTTKTMEIEESNKILVLCLKRFHENRKNDREVQIPFQLDSSDVVGSNNAKRYEQKKYRLYGVIVHIGHSLNGGHYYAYCRVRGDKWIRCDDRWVDEVQKKDLNFRDAYALFYQLQEYPKKI